MSNKPPLVSIVIANHNGRELIAECLDSLLGIDYPKDKLEVIVADNCSTDDSVRYIRANYKKVIIIENEVNNYCLACNRGIRRAKGNYICLLNNDVRVRKDWLGELIKAIKNDNAIGAVTSKLLKEDGAIQNAGLSELPDFYWDERGAGKKDKKYDIAAQVDAISGACVLYRKKALEQVGLLDEDFVMFGEDVDMSFRLKKNNWKLVYAPGSAAYHKVHGSCNEEFARGLIERNRLLFIAKHYPFRLADALVGNGYFTVNDGNKNSGRIFDFMPDIFMKLSKEHGQQVIKEVIKDLFEELKRIINYENKKLEEDLKNILIDLIETTKDRDHYRDSEKHYMQAIQEKDSHIVHYKEEIESLSNKLKESLDNGLRKESIICDMERRLGAYQKEIGTLNTRLKENIEAASLKDGAIRQMQQQFNGINQELGSYKQEAANLADKLKDSLTRGLVKDDKIIQLSEKLSATQHELQAYMLEKERRLQELSQKFNGINQELGNYRQEAANLADKLKDSLTRGLVKDDKIIQLSEKLSASEKGLQAYKEETANLANKLKESLEASLKLEKELGSIYASEGFRFVLKPLWKIIYSSRLTLRFLVKQISNIAWTAVILALSPFILTQALLFLCEHIAQVLFGWISNYFRKERKVVSFNELSVSIVIPNWNGIDLLKKCLSSIYEADGFRDGNYEVLVVDDASTYDIAQCIKDEFPRARVIRNRSNQGFGRSCNRGVKEARGELIVLLNNDIMVSRDFLAPLKEHFKDSEVFAVSPKLYYWDKKTFNYGMHMGKFKDGYLSLWNEAETGNGDRISEACPTIFAVGGAMCFRKKDFLWLGGFDGIYRPNSWEDIDISYRAQKRGLKVIYEPASLLYHKGAATVNYLRHKEIKNELLFMWKNLTDYRMLLSHINQLTRFLRYGKHSSRMAFLRGYLWALGYFISALGHKFRESKYIKLSDREILNRCMLYYRNFMRNNYTHRRRKTILLITPFIIYPLNSGGKLRIYNLCKRLKEKYDLILLSLIHNEREREYAGFLKDIFKEIHLVHTKTPSREFLFPGRYRYSYSSFFIEKLLQIQEKTAIDAVHIESNELLYLTRHIKYIPVIYTEHDISILSCQNSYYEKSKSYSLSHFIDYFKIVRYHSHVYHRIDKVIALSKEDIRTIRAFSPDSDCLLIPTGVDVGHFGFREKTGKSRSLIFVGHYPHYPNEEAAVYFCHKIFPLIKNKIPEVTLKLVGSGPTEKILGLSRIKGVEVVGEVADVNPYLQEAAVFVCAFRRSAGIKGKVLEAMAAGTPVVSTKRGSYGIDAVDGLEILIADKPADFAAKVITLLKDDELYRKISRYARILVEDKYDWDKITGQLDAAYRDIMDEGFIRQPEKEKEETAIPDNPLIRAIIEKTNTLVDSALNYLEKQERDTAIDLNPQELHLELTHSCNSRCITCDIWDYHKRNNKSVEDELTLEQIRNFIRNAKRLKDIKTVVLSGGEPFLRPDLVDICLSIKDILPQASLGILTNGLDTDAIISKTKDILAKVKPACLWVGSSLDGLGQAYDRIRGTRAGFSRFQRTVERFKKELPGISFSATFVLTPFNIDELIPCWEFADKNGLDFFAQFGVSKQARSKETFQWQDGDFIKIQGYIRRIIEKMINKISDLQSFYGSLERIDDKINLLTKIYYWAGLVDFQKTKKRFAGYCEAASKFAMLDPYGNMFFCPILKDRVIGNIRNRGLDDLWVSQEANKIRDFIKGGECSCWLVCTLFPIVDRALSLYRDRAVVSVPKRIETMKSNLLFNDEEFSQKKIILQSLPQGITLGANYKCNANCLFCLGGEYKPFSLKLYKNYFERQLGNMISQAEYVSLCGMGELLLLPDIKNFLEYINTTLPDKNKILTTNGLALGASLSDMVTESNYSIQISLHASNAELHERLTGLKGGFDKIIGQVRHIVAKRKNSRSPHISFIFLANTMNIEDLPNFVELAASLGVDSVQCNYLTIFQPPHLKLSCFFMQEVTNAAFDKALQRAEDLKISLKIPPKFAANNYFRTTCPEPWKNIYVDTEGAVSPCCYSGEHFGELEKQDIFSIWNNVKFKGVRTDLACGNPIQMCKYCLNNDPANVNLLNAHVSFRPEVQKLILN